MDEINSNPTEASRLRLRERVADRRSEGEGSEVRLSRSDVAYIFNVTAAAMASRLRYEKRHQSLIGREYPGSRVPLIPLPDISYQQGARTLHLWVPESISAFLDMYGTSAVEENRSVAASVREARRKAK